MNLTINLLPDTLKISKKNDAQKKLIIRASIYLLSVMVLITLGLFIFALIDSFQIQKENKSVEEIKSRLQTLNDKESLADVVKTRVDTITNISKQDSTQELSFNLISQLLPESISLDNLTIDKTNKVILSGQTNSSSVLETFFNNLTDPKINDGKILASKLASLAVTKDNYLRFDLDIATK